MSEHPEHDCGEPACAMCNEAAGRILDDLNEFGQSTMIEVMAWDLTPEASNALFDRVVEAAHALDEQVICSMRCPAVATEADESTDAGADS